MPKILKTAGGHWQSVGISGELAKDNNFSYLSAFEELVYEKPHSATSSKKKEKKTKLLVKKKGPLKKRIKSELRTRKKRTLTGKANEPSPEAQNDAEGEVVGLNVVDEREKLGSEEKIGKRKKLMKGLKRKLSKKARFSTESPPKKCCLDEEAMAQGNEDASTSRKSSGNDVDLTLWHDFFLPDEVMLALKELKFSAPTEIQSLVLPSAVRDKLDILGAAETGSGKTLAYLIPVVCRLLETELVEKERKLKALIFAPTRELVVQIKKQLDILLRYTKFKGAIVVGGLSQQKQERLIKYCPEVIVATPGRFWTLSETAALDSYLGDLSSLRVVVVDETDRMAEKGHFQELQHILSRMKSQAPVKRQTLVFSATLTFVHLPDERHRMQQSGITTAEKIKQLIDLIGLRPERKIFDITRSVCTPETLVEAKMNCSDLLEKDSNVLYLLTRYPGRTLIFTNSIDASKRLHGILSKVRYDGAVLIINAKMPQKRRLINLERFSKNDNSVLIATDVAARGLDIPGIQHVVHYQVSKTAESYVHRSGRTARISNKGLAVMMVDPQDVKFYARICRNLSRENQFPTLPIDRPDLMEALKERVAAVSQVESLEHRIKKITSRENWFTRTAREAELLDDRGDEKAFSSTQLKELKRELSVAEAKVKAVLKKSLPNFDTSLKTRYITPEIVKSYEKEATKSALVSLDEYETKNDAAKLRKTKHFTTRQIIKLKKSALKKKSRGGNSLKRW